MPRPTQEEKDLVWRNCVDAIGALVDAVVGREVPRSYDYQKRQYFHAKNLAKDFQVGQAVYKYNKEFDSAITRFVCFTVGLEVPEGPYSEPVYEAALNVAEVVQASEAVLFYRVTDLDEYEAELRRRRQIGPTIDLATAETTARVVDVSDPYDIRDRSYHAGWGVREYFARHPGGDWVHFGDLPDATNDALWQRDEQILVQEGLDEEFFATCRERAAEHDNARCAEPDASTR